MKLSDKKISGSVILALALPFLLIVPNIALCITEEMSFWSGAVNILLPLSVYALLMSLWRRTGVTTLLMLPFMIYAGFQIVLLYLYGGSLIAVDMFLNVVTTNPTEVGELLGNLAFAICVVVVLYVPALVTAVVLIFKKKRLTSLFARRYRRVATVATLLSCTLLDITYLIVPHYNMSRELFPVNVIGNMCRAVKRSIDVADYPNTSAEFSYNAVNTRPTDIPEVYLLVIGETSRGENWQLLGYDRPTNPHLSMLDSLVVFDKAVTQSNTTHKSVPMIISSLTAENFDSIGSHKSIFTAFKEAGYHTYLFSNQTRNRSYTEYFCNEADRQVYIKDSLGRYAMDHSLLPLLDEALADSLHRKKFIVMHTYGSHFNYRDRYPKEFAGFTPDNYPDANTGNRDKLINSFDNTILYIDNFLAEAAQRLDRSGIPSAMIYTSDHGEDIFDDSRERFLHASPTPTFHQLYVPMLVWMSGEYNRQFGDSAYVNLYENRSQTISPTETVFPTMLTLAGINTPRLDASKSLASNRFTTSPLLYITDLNEAVPVGSSGIKEQDRKLFNEKQIKL
ncbi:MAG: lipid A phosphoethanolamine transferase [Muribaculaceae bacterium]|nr:lipid A phosphoethanolamine transferase [Muribaculaceae bacterium]